LVLETVRQNFRPEFLNRVDEIIIFKPLSREQIKSIVDIQLERLRKRLAERRISLQLTPVALELIANEGYDLTYGARPLKRVIQRRIQDRSRWPFWAASSVRGTPSWSTPKRASSSCARRAGRRPLRSPRHKPPRLSRVSTIAERCQAALAQR